MECQGTPAMTGLAKQDLPLFYRPRSWVVFFSWYGTGTGEFRAFSLGRCIFAPATGFPSLTPVEMKGYKNVMNLPERRRNHEILVKSKKTFTTGKYISRNRAF
jgi:hypothetical protein